MDNKTYEIKKSLIQDQEIKGATLSVYWIIIFFILQFNYYFI